MCNSILSDEETEILCFHFSINGTDTNPYEKYGLLRSPFSSVAKAEYDGISLALNALGGEPIKSESEIHERLGKRVSRELKEIICKYYKPGKNVEVKLYWKPGTKDVNIKARIRG
jgi:hypothetical protein